VTPTRVLIADDHAPTLEDVAVALENDPRFTVCATAPDAPQAIAAALRQLPDLCLLDVRMPGSGIGAAWEISARLPDTRVVMLTVSRDDRDLFAALRAGAVGYLLKDTPPARIADALAPVLAGEVTMPTSLVSRLVEQFRDPAPRRRALLQRSPDCRLTSREWEIIDLLRRDLSTTQIARRLFISDVTVRSHIASALHKLRAPDRRTAIAMFGPPEGV
jgi:two-component system nitrate/nitrite response regulator NarL